mgnify:CR=1 FL=1
MNKNHVVFHGSVNSTSLSAAAHAGGSVHEAGLQLVAQTQAHGRTQRDTVDGVRRDGHFHLQLLAEVLRQAVELCAAAGEDDAVAVDVAGQLRRSLLQHLMGGGADLLAQAHDRLVEVGGGDIDTHGQAGEQAAALDLHGLVEIRLLGAAGHVLFQVLSGALADGDAELVAHELQDLFVVVVAGHADAGGLDLAAEAQHGDVGGAAADVDDHPAIRHGDVDAGAESCGDRLINEVDLTRTGGHDGLHHGVALDAGDGGRHTDGHTGLDHVGAVDLIDEAADELPGHGVVADDAILQREDGGDIVGRASHHSQCFIAGFQHGVLAGIHCHNAGLVEHHALALLRDDDGSSTKVDADIILCHNCLNPFSAFLYHVCNARSGGQKTKTVLV